MAGLFDGTPLQRPVTCAVCEKPLAECRCPRDADGNVLLPQQQRVVVRFEKRPGGKVVSIVEELDAHAADLPGLLKQLRSRCAAGGSIQDGTLQLQGDHREPIAATLRELGYRVTVR